MIEAEGVDIRGTSGTIAEFSPKEDCIPEESGTDSTDLIMPFYEGSAWVYEGRYPTEEEYAQGSAVCLAPRFFAENNGLSVGDQVTTRLYYTDTGNGPDVEGIGADELIVPFRSVRNPMENIVDYGAMADDNTSFRIENGSDLYLL